MFDSWVPHFLPKEEKATAKPFRKTFALTLCCDCSNQQACLVCAGSDDYAAELIALKPQGQFIRRTFWGSGVIGSIIRYRGSIPFYDCWEHAIR